MRDPRPGLVWSVQRVAIRARYGDYMTSAGWFRHRERWLERYRAAHGEQDPTCAVCRAAWTLRVGDLHHRSYTRLGQEDWRDLLALCRSDHHLLHSLLESNPAWRRLPREQATDLMAAQLRGRANKERNGGAEQQGRP